MALKDLTGLRFDRLVVIRRADNYKNGASRWECKCDCGKIKTISGYSLTAGKTKSCGCFHDEGNHITHGMSNGRLYTIWCNMKRRCKSKAAKNYGGRGITVCAEWAGCFETFRDWALANGYREDLTIERKDPNGDYCPENCTWATMVEQQNNKRDNHMISFRGKTQTLQQWANETGIKAATIRYRLRKGWSVDIALTKSPNQQKEE